MKNLFFTLYAVSLFFYLPLNYAHAEETSSPEIVVHLLDYLAKDYGGAVQNGKVVSASEYAEQIEFVGIVSKNAKNVSKLKADTIFIQDILNLELLIKNKGTSDEVSKEARRLQQRAIKLAEIEVYPREVPNLQDGAKLFQKSCVSCHGNTGHGDGVAGVNLDPKPANFHDSDLVWNSAPYKFYNTIRLGVPGTGMTAFSNLSDEEVWALAYYIKSLPYEGKATEVSTSAVSMIDLATMTDAELADKLGGRSESNLATISSLRAGAFVALTKDPLSIAESLLSESIEAVKKNDYELAAKHALNAYLQGIEPIEPKMKANMPGFVEEVEGMMSEYRSSISKKVSVNVLEDKKKNIFTKLNEARTHLSQVKMSPGVAFGATFSIFLREGFEAILIIIILLSILRAMDQPKAIKWVHAGWMSAVGVGIAGWFASGLLLEMSGLSRELLEGAISILAVVVLIYVGFWLHRYTEMKKWRAFLEEKLRHGLNKGNFLGLAVVAFLAVFREAFEVILFLRAIWIDLDSSGQNVAGTGVLISFLLLLVFSYFAVKQSKKLPLQKLFQVCSWTMMGLAVILAGKGLHSLQEAGVVPVSALPVSVRIDLLGIYPSYQTISLQIGVVVLFAILFFSDRNSNR